MTVDTATLGKRIADARVRLGITQAEVAIAAGLDRTALAKIESGTRRISALELVAIAEQLNQRVEWFVDPEPASLVSHRARSDAPTASVDQELERLARDVEFVGQLDPTLLTGAPLPADVPTTADSAETLAASARKATGLNQTEPAVELVARFSEIGLLAFSIDLGENTADAGTILLDRGGVTLINSASKVGRRRMALTHELGHYLLADDYTIDWRVADQPSHSAVETWLERFARAFLLPAKGLSAQWEHQRVEHDLAIAALRTASWFRVDMATLARRLLELGIEAAANTDEIRRVRPTKADIVENDLFVPVDLDATTLPRRYQLAVLRLYRSETISAERALELLHGTFDPSGLPDLPSGSPSELWQFTG